MSAMKRKKQVLKSADFSAISVNVPYSTSINSAILFDDKFKEAHDSPLDQFLTNTNALNVIYLNAKSLSPVLSRLVFMGYVSAAESYIRALIRGLINIDEYAQRLVEAKLVSFGAAKHHSKRLLPEALMEGISFAKSSTIQSTLENLVGVKLPVAELKKIFEDFNILCQLRHCCIHRFGNLGSNNAIELELITTHKHLLEKPINLNKKDLEQISSTLRTLVRTVNNETFRLILERTIIRNKKGKPQTDEKPKYSVSWIGDYKKDRNRFSKYYKLFSTHVDAIPSPPMAEMYQRFCNALIDTSSP